MSPNSTTSQSEQAKKSTALSSFAKTFLKIGFAALLIYWMIHKGALDLGSFTQLATPAFACFWLGCIFLQIFINNLRWLYLMEGQGIKSSVRETLPLSFIGMFFNFFMPGGVGGDVVKGYYLLQDHPDKRLAGAISIFMDRVMGFFVMIGMASVALFFNLDILNRSRELRLISTGVLVLFAGFLFFFFLSLTRTLKHPNLNRILFEKMPGGRFFRRVYDMLHSYRNHPRALLHAVWLSVASQLFTVAFVYFVGVALNVHMPISGYLFLVPIGQVAQALPISPAGIGVGQAAFYFLFNVYLGYQSPLGATAVTAMQVASFTWGILGAAFYLRRKSPQRTGGLQQATRVGESN